MPSPPSHLQGHRQGAATPLSAISLHRFWHIMPQSRLQQAVSTLSCEQPASQAGKQAPSISWHCRIERPRWPHAQHATVAGQLEGRGAGRREMGLCSGSGCFREVRCPARQGLPNQAAAPAKLYRRCRSCAEAARAQANVRHTATPVAQPAMYGPHHWQLSPGLFMEAMATIYVALSALEEARHRECVRPS